MMISNDYTVIVPHDWSDEEALIVVQFLDQITQSIYNLHGDRIMAAMRRRNAASGVVKYHLPNTQEPPFSPQSAPPDED